MAPLTTLPHSSISRELYDGSATRMGHLRSLSVIFRRQDDLEKRNFVTHKNPLFIIVLIMGAVLLCAVIGAIYAKCASARRKSLHAKEAFDRRRSSVMSLSKGTIEKGRLGSSTSTLGPDEDWTPQKLDTKLDTLQGLKLQAIHEVPSSDELKASANVAEEKRMPVCEEENEDEDERRDTNEGWSHNERWNHNQGWINNDSAKGSNVHSHKNGNEHRRGFINEHANADNMDIERQQNCERCGGYVESERVCEGCGEPHVG